MHAVMRKRMAGVLVALVLMVWLGGCSGPGAGGRSGGAGDIRPDWVDAPGRRYPDRHYLSASGSGDTREAAMDAAVAALARIFETRVESEETVLEQYREIMSRRGGGLESETRMERRITVSARQDLFNIRLGDTYRDRMGRVYAVVYMERGPSAAIYRQRIAEHAAHVAGFLQHAVDAPDPVQRYAFLQAAAIIAQINAATLQQLDIVLPGSARTVTLAYRPTDVMTAAVKAAGAIRVVVQADPDPGGALSAALREAVTGMGFSTVDGPEAELVMRGTFHLEPVRLARQDAAFVRYEGAVEVRQGQRGISSITVQGREGHVTEEGAGQRAISRACRDLREAVMRDLRRHFDRMAAEQGPHA